MLISLLSSFLLVRLLVINTIILGVNYKVFFGFFPGQIVKHVEVVTNSAGCQIIFVGAMAIKFQKFFTQEVKEFFFINV